MRISSPGRSWNESGVDAAARPGHTIYRNFVIFSRSAFARSLTLSSLRVSALAMARTDMPLPATRGVPSGPLNDRR